MNENLYPENDAYTPNLKSGLYLVATPIGNLRDISLRALDVLRGCDMIFCEDTRVTGKLLNAYQIKARMQPYNDHSDEARRQQIVDKVKEGGIIALVSDAGMPMISDPGYKLVNECAAQGVYVTTIPGATAPLCALQLSAMPTDKFCFLGFLPNKAKARQDVLQKWENVDATLVAFESAGRLSASLSDIGAVFGTRQVAVVREITKLYEEVKRGTSAELVEYYAQNGKPKGEIVLVIAPPEEKAYSSDDVKDMIRTALKTMKVKDAARDVAQKTGLKMSDLYDVALAVSKEE